MGLIKECIETKKKEREKAYLEQKRKETEAILDKRVETVLKTSLSIVSFVVGCLLLAISALDAEMGAISFITYLQVILGVVFFAIVPMVWIYDSKK